MPYYLIKATEIPKAYSKKLFGATEYYLGDYGLSHLRYGSAPPDVCMTSKEKPTEIPDGFALKFFPDYEEIDAMNVRWQDQRADPTTLFPPWKDCDRDERHDFHTCGHMDIYRPIRTADGKIAYFPSWLHVHENRREEVSIGRFLHIIWDNLDGGWEGWATRHWGALTDDFIRMWSEVPKAQTKDDVKFARTGDEIEWVYRNGPQSCMSKELKAYPRTGGIHPVRAYGDSDLAVAYLTKSRDQNKVSQRVMCWPAKKIYLRIYGTGPIEQFLQELGYTKGEHGAFHNARLPKIELTKGDGDILAPYIDWHDYVVETKHGMRIFSKLMPNPLAPDIMVRAKPPKRLNAWAATQSQSGVLTRPVPCSGCKGQISQTDRENGHSVCSPCRKARRSCAHCSVMHHKKSYPWTIAADRYQLEVCTTVRALAKAGAQYLCKTCANSPSVVRSYTNADYRLFPLNLAPEVPTHATENTAANAAIQAPDGQ